MKMKYEEPVINYLVPRPEYSAGMDNPVRVLNGIWKLKHTTEPKELILSTDFDGWEDIDVPSDLGARFGTSDEFTGKYVYKKWVTLPNDRISYSYVLRFEGVNGFAEIYIDGQYAGEHKNAFVSWDLDITQLVKDKDQFVLTVVVDEKADQVSAFNHGGILHSVLLYILPENYYTGIHTTTVFDDQFKDGTLQINYKVKNKSQDYQYQAILLAPDQFLVKEIDLERYERGGDRAGYKEIKVTAPLSWDAEHPRLYTLKLIISKDNHTIEEISHRFGFRQITRQGNQLYVNGKEVKLRGVCRHEITALDGRCLTKELIEQDVALFKEANCNYIRTSHYPPSEYFLQQCDEQGIYVEDELALAFIARTLPYTQRDPKETTRYLSHFSELVARDYSHPCVLIWSLCNESFGGYNFDLLNQYAHKLDHSRPTKFSYPMTMREEHEAVDVWSIHYTNLEEDLAKKCDNVSVGYTPGYDMPVLHDEYAHIPCYNRTEHRRDPNVRSFWGESIKRFWDKIWNTKGALGGAIWAGIDESNLFVGGNICLEWGIIDMWRRRKPEFYMTRKAYSPISISDQEAMEREGRIGVELENRFCHTNLSEIRIEWRCGNAEGSVMGPHLLPREKGTLFLDIPFDSIKANTILELDFYDDRKNKLDEFKLPIRGINEKGDFLFPGQKSGQLVITDNQEEVLVKGNEFSLVFDQATGLVKKGRYKEKVVLIGGPYLNIPYLRTGQWIKKESTYKKDDESVEITVSGSYGKELEVTFDVLIDPDGRIETRYTINTLKVKLPKQVKLRVGVDCGGLDELGVYYLTSSHMDTLYWKRKGLWTVYPEDHIARCEGTANKFSEGSIFGVKPDISWSQEMKNFILNGKYDVDYKGTNDFRSLKEKIYTARLYSTDEKGSLTVISDGNHSVRLEIEEPKESIISDRDARIQYHGTWYPMEDYSGSLHNTEMWSKEAGAYIECTFTGIGVVWYGPVDINYGIARVYLDEELMDDSINQRVNGVDFPGSAAGYDKKYGYPLYSISGLEDKEHKLRIEVTGDHEEDSADSYIVMDYLRILHYQKEEPVRLIINNDFNYPHLAWGNYMKPPVLIEEGYCNKVIMKIGE